MKRRHFLQLAAMLPALPSITIAGRVFAAPPASPRFLLVFLRGGYDCANMLVPYASDFYYESRPNIAIARPDAAANTGAPALDAAARGSALALDSDWALTPALRESLAPMYQSKEVAFVPFAGTDDLSRSHFETQDNIERGQPTRGRQEFRSGFMARLCGDAERHGGADRVHQCAAADVPGRGRHSEHLAAAQSASPRSTSARRQILDRHVRRQPPADRGRATALNCVSRWRSEFADEMMRPTAARSTPAVLRSRRSASRG